MQEENLQELGFDNVKVFEVVEQSTEKLGMSVESVESTHRTSDRYSFPRNDPMT